MGKKKNKDTITGIAIGGTLGLGVVGAIPSSGLVGETTLRTNFSIGVGKVGKVLPAIGKVIGTKLVLKPIGKLKKTINKLDFGGIKL